MYKDIRTEQLRNWQTLNLSLKNQSISEKERPLWMFSKERVTWYYFLSSYCLLQKYFSNYHLICVVDQAFLTESMSKGPLYLSMKAILFISIGKGLASAEDRVSR